MYVKVQLSHSQLRWTPAQREKLQEIEEIASFFPEIVEIFAACLMHFDEEFPLILILLLLCLSLQFIPRQKKQQHFVLCGAKVNGKQKLSATKETLR